MRHNRYKVTCALCGNVFDNDYKGKRCKTTHPNYTASTLPLRTKNQTKLVFILILFLIQIKALDILRGIKAWLQKVNLTPSRELMGVSCFLRAAWSFCDKCVSFCNIVNLINNL